MLKNTSLLGKNINEVFDIIGLKQKVRYSDYQLSYMNEFVLFRHALFGEEYLYSERDLRLLYTWIFINKEFIELWDL